MINLKPAENNIGKKESRKRYFLGSAGFSVAGIYTILTYFNYIDPQAELILPLSIFIGFAGFIQGYTNFCPACAMKDRSGKNREERLGKILRSTKVVLYSLFGTIVLTALIQSLVLA